MSKLEVTSFEVTNISANSIAAGTTTVNSTGIYLDGSKAIINTSAISVTSATGNVSVSSSITNIPRIDINGTKFTQLFNETVNAQIFTANGTWTKPSWATTGNELVIVHMWGGGGGGSVNCGGGGGSFVFGYYKSSQLSSTASVTVGLGGSPSSTLGSPGGNSSFNTNLIAYGGGPGDSNVTRGGGGGGWGSVGVNANGGGPLGGNSTVVASTFGGGAGGSSTVPAGGDSIYGGSGGGVTTGLSGRSIYGATGGSNVGRVFSVYGGSGGNNSSTATSPGGGGGARSSAPDGTGARGEVRVYTLRKTILNYGDFYEGGYYIGNVVVDNNTYGIILSPKASGQSPTDLRWKTTNIFSAGTDSLVDGLTNTENMNNADHPAAQYCRGLTIGGYTDWYLPAKDELNLVWVNRASLTAGQTNDDALGEYWTSTQASATSAWAQLFMDGSQFIETKGTNRVRAVRRFLIS